jgi:Acetyltransferase (GNAT) domain
MLDLFAAGGFSNISLARFRWQVLTRDACAPTAWVAAEPDGRIVGTYCGTPIKLRLADTDTLGMHGSHAMTDPTYRRQGILTAVAGAAQAAWAEAGYRVQIGVPWGTWGSRRDALGWQRVADLVWVRRWLAPEAALARKTHLPIGKLPVWAGLSRKPRPDPTVSVRVLQAVEPALDELWASASSGWRHAVVRDAGWVDWRFFQPPERTHHVLLAERAGRPVGYLAARIERASNGATNAWLADLFAARHDEGARRSLLYAGLAHLEHLRVERVMALVPAGGEQQRELRRARFTGEAGGDFALVRLDRALDFASVANPADWLITAGDFDVV